MKKIALAAAVACMVLMGTGMVSSFAQDAAPAAAPAADAAAAAPATEEAAGTIVPGAGAQPTSQSSGGFWAVVFGSGWLGVLLWVALFGAGGLGIYFAVDCAITVRATRIMPQALVDNVTTAMAEGDVIKALKSCEEEPGPLANILSAGFSHVEEGYDVIQEAISTAADLETEKLTQKLTWLSVMANIAPMLGLLGTVQGMILAFGNLATGAPDIGVLAMNIAQALYTTAAGLATAIPCVCMYYTFRNSANRIVLHMEAMTVELIKDLRNVEVVAE